MKKILLMLLALFISAPPVLADEVLTEAERKGAMEFIDRLVSDAIESVLTSTASQEVKETRFREIFLQALDREQVARAVLGRVWRDASPAEQKDFLDAFDDSVVAQWSGMLSQYSGQSIKATGATRKPSRTGTRIEVASHVVAASGSTASPVRIAWLLTLEDGKHRVIDISVEGVSMAINYQQEYRAIILAAQDANRNPMQELIARIRRNTDELKARAR
jgi:phospholipid transport system substrate-binding protein